jgi:transcriptional regulator with XRE-family HTH domain
MKPYISKPMHFRLKLDEKAHEIHQWNLRELAEALDLPYQSVLYWNQGRCMPKLHTLLKLLDILGCPFEALVEVYPSFYDTHPKRHTTIDPWF